MQVYRRIYWGNHGNKKETALKYMQVELSWFWTKAKIISKFRDPLMMGKTNLHFSATYARPDLSIMWRVNPAAVLGYIASLKATLVCLFLRLNSWVISILRLIHLYFVFIYYPLCVIMIKKNNELFLGYKCPIWNNRLDYAVSLKVFIFCSAMPHFFVLFFFNYE